MTDFDFIIVGAGIAGASAAYELQKQGSVALLERERLPGHHTTGRSAAFLVDSYANAVVSRLTRAGRAFFETPPEGFADAPIVTPNAVLWISRADQSASMDAAMTNGCNAGATMTEVSVAEGIEICPVLRKEYVDRAVVESAALHIDVAGLLQAFLRGFRRRGGRIMTSAEVHSIKRDGSAWEVGTNSKALRAPIVVNAAGAWCDRVGQIAGAKGIGLQPLRRTAITFDGPSNCDIRSWPLLMDVDEDFYLKPEGAQLLASPCDETPSEPCDTAPEDYDVALAGDRIQRATTLPLRHIRRRWAGLRSFVADRSPVIGMDPDRAGFFWLAGQGGFGIMTSPAASRAAAGLILDGSLPRDLQELGLTNEMLSVGRLRN